MIEPILSIAAVSDAVDVGRGDLHDRAPMMIGRPRRCLDCGAALPADADARRSFCGQACVSRAYRKRVRLLKRTARAREVIASIGQLNRLEKAGIVTGYLCQRSLKIDPLRVSGIDPLGGVR